MVDLGKVVELKETTSAEEANRLRSEGWVIMGLTQGIREDGEAYWLYSLGRTGSRPGPTIARNSTSAPQARLEAGNDSDRQAH